MLNEKLVHLSHFTTKFRQLCKEQTYTCPAPFTAYSSIIIITPNGLFYSFSRCSINKARLRFYRLLYGKNYKNVPKHWDNLHIQKILSYGHPFETKTH